MFDWDEQAPPIVSCLPVRSAVISRRGFPDSVLNMLPVVRYISVSYTHLDVYKRQFFESRGYTVERENTVIRQGIELKNYFMTKKTD